MSRLNIPPGYARSRHRLVRDDSRFQQLAIELAEDAELLDAAPEDAELPQLAE